MMDNQIKKTEELSLGDLQDRLETIAFVVADKVGNGRSYDPILGRAIMAQILALSLQSNPIRDPQNEEEEKIFKLFIESVQQIIDGFLFPIYTLISIPLGITVAELEHILSNDNSYKGDILRWWVAICEEVGIQNAIRGNQSNEMRVHLERTRFNGKYLPYTERAEIVGELSKAQSISNLSKKYQNYLTGNIDGGGEY